MHLTRCQEVGRQSALDAAIQSLDNWISLPHTDPLLRESAVTYLQKCGTCCWSDIMISFPSRYQALGRAQDKLGWDSFLAGMISSEVQQIQADHLSISGSRMSL